MTDTEWKIAPIWVRTDKGWFEIPGWTNGLWCLDWRAFYSDDIDDIGHMFTVTHAPTGFSACSVAGSLSEAQTFVAHLSAAADWNFTETGEAAKRADALRKAKEVFADEYPTVDILRGNGGHPPIVRAAAHAEPNRSLAA